MKAKAFAASAMLMLARGLPPKPIRLVRSPSLYRSGLRVAYTMSTMYCSIFSSMYTSRTSWRACTMSSGRITLFTGVVPPGRVFCRTMSFSSSLRG